MADPIRVVGLKEFATSLRVLDRDLAKALRVALNGVADVIIGYARPRIPKRTGRAAASLRPRSTRTEVRITAGGRVAPYYPWLDFGGKVGPKASVRRPFIQDGRYLYKAYFDNRPAVERALTVALVEVARRAGLEVTGV